MVFGINFYIKKEAGGLKEVIASIKGTNIYSTLKYESGVHRVQRVPDTETQGRVHTSANPQWLFYLRLKKLILK